MRIINSSTGDNVCLILLIFAIIKKFIVIDLPAFFKPKVLTLFYSLDPKILKCFNKLQ